MRALSRLRDGLVGAWCPSVSGWGGNVLRDLSGQGNHGTLTNMDPATDWVIAGGSLSLDFDGSNDRVSIGRIHDYLGGWTFVIWVVPRSVSVHQSYFSHGSDATFFDFRSIGVNSAGKASCNEADATGTQSAISTTTLVAGTLYCIAAVFPRSGSFAIYLNGVLEASNASRKLPTAAVWSIGSTVLNGQPIYDYANANILDSRVYSRSLTIAEIQQLYNGGPGFGLRPERTRRLVQGQTFTAARLRRQSLIGSGVY